MMGDDMNEQREVLSVVSDQVPGHTEVRQPLMEAQADKRTLAGYLFFWSGQKVSELGSSIAQFAIIWWITLDTGSALYLSMASLVGFVPVAYWYLTRQPLVRKLQVQATDVTLYVRVVGNPESGNVLIAIHGGPGMSSGYMASLEQLAGDKFAVVTYDQRGTGRSTSPSDDSADYSLLKYIEDLEAVRQAVGADQVHLFGHSWGGVLALRYATIYPQRVRSIVLMGSGPPSMQAWRDAEAYMAQRIAALQQQGIIPAHPTSVGDLLPSYFSDPEFEAPDELKNLYYNPDVQQLTWSALGDFDFTADVARLDHRVLFLWGEDDPFGMPTAQATVTALSVAQVEFVVLDKCGHFWHERPEDFYSRVRAFLDMPP